MEGIEKVAQTGNWFNLGTFQPMAQL